MTNEKEIWLKKIAPPLLFIVAVIVTLVFHPIMYILIYLIYSDLIGVLMFLSLLLIVGYSVFFGDDRRIIREAPMVIVAIATIAVLLFIGPFVLPEFSKETSLGLLKIATGLIIIVAIIILYSFLPSFTKKEEGRRQPEPI